MKGMKDVKVMKGCCFTVIKMHVDIMLLAGKRASLGGEAAAAFGRMGW
jgi:hypothetical protein